MINVIVDCGSDGGNVEDAYNVDCDRVVAEYTKNADELK